MTLDLPQNRVSGIITYVTLNATNGVVFYLGMLYNIAKFNMPLALSRRVI